MEKVIELIENLQKLGLKSKLIDINSLLNILRNGDDYSKKKRLRTLVSLESGFWDFIVKKKLFTDGIITDGNKTTERTLELSFSSPVSYIGKFVLKKKSNTVEYRLMLSSVQDDLSNFLLDNIKHNEKNIL